LPVAKLHISSVFAALFHKKSTLLKGALCLCSGY
jgi:hypothetical protein